jgi:hypothetical protein
MKGRYWCKTQPETKAKAAAWPRLGVSSAAKVARSTSRVVAWVPIGRADHKTVARFRGEM